VALLLLAAGWLELEFLRPASVTLGPLTIPLLTGISLIGPAVVLLFRFGKRTERLYLLGRALSLGAVVPVGAVGSLGTLLMMMGIGEPGPLVIAATTFLMIAVRVVLAGCLHAAIVAGREAR
jgi:hypothetical protein